MSDEGRVALGSGLSDVEIQEEFSLDSTLETESRPRIPPLLRGTH